MESKKEIKNSKTKKRVLIGLGITAASAIAGFFGWKYFTKSDKMFASDFSEPQITPSLPSYSSSKSNSYSTPPSSPARKDEFPLKKGSKGERVKKVQELLISKFGKSILPRYGADGDFGSEMETALKSKGLPTIIEESQYNLFLGSGTPDVNLLAKQLFEAAKRKNFTSAITGLKKIRNTSDYSSISDIFKTYRFPDSLIRKTLVTGMLDAFSSSNQREAIRNEFFRMGLKETSGKWSLSGLDSKLLITTARAEITDPRTGIKSIVPANTILGYYIRHNTFQTRFNTLQNEKELIIESNKVKFYA